MSLIYYKDYGIFHVVLTVLTVQLQGCGVFCLGFFPPPTCVLLSITQMGEKTQTNPEHLTRTCVRTSFKDAKNIHSHLNSHL